MLFDIYNPHANYVVTKDYVKIIEDSLQQAGHTTQVVDSLKKSKKNRNRGVVCIQASTTRLAAHCGYGSIVRWVQGAGEAESFMRHHSKLRFLVLSALNWYAFKKSDYILFVSETLKRYYEKRFHMNFEDYYIMPCFNEEIDRTAFLMPDKYTDNTFIYAGSLDAWQCFEPTVALYAEVEKRVDNCSFRVLAANREKVEEILKKYGVKRYSIGFVPKEQVAAEMAKAKFGFCLREDDIVNRVATPTKLSNYIANGVIPVCSEYVEDFHQIAKNCEYCLCANPGDLGEPVQRLVKLCNENISPEKIYQEYNNAFGNYYSREYHIKRLSARLKEFFA